MSTYHPVPGHWQFDTFLTRTDTLDAHSLCHGLTVKNRLCRNPPLVKTEPKAEAEIERRKNIYSTDNFCTHHKPQAEPAYWDALRHPLADPAGRTTRASPNAVNKRYDLKKVMLVSGSRAKDPLARVLFAPESSKASSIEGVVKIKKGNDKGFKAKQVEGSDVLAKNAKKVDIKGKGRAVTPENSGEELTAASASPFLRRAIAPTARNRPATSAGGNDEDEEESSVVDWGLEEDDSDDDDSVVRHEDGEEQQDEEDYEEDDEEEGEEDELAEHAAQDEEQASKEDEQGDEVEEARGDDLAGPGRGGWGCVIMKYILLGQLVRFWGAHDA